MSTFSKKFQKFLIYFFTGTSALIMVLGIQRAKETDALGITSVSDNNTPESQADGNTVKSVSTTEGSAKLLEKIITAQGTAYQTPWGNVATRIQVKNGQVVAVEIPELPDSPPSIYAKSYLIDQALRSGNANIQGVSGATITTNAFKSSLESALASARKQNASRLTNTTTTQSSPVIQKTLLNTTTVKIPPAYIPPQMPTPPITIPTTIPKVGVSGTFTGNPYSTKWGNAVASIIVANGKITNVTMPQVPNSPPSIEAEPILVSQALSAGNANIQGVSGATMVSNAFRLSLESAIAKANAQALTQGATTVVTSPTTTITSSTNPTTTNTQPIKYRKSKKYHDDDEDDDDD